jgi:membrane-bound serine protease (ClpP class)
VGGAPLSFGEVTETLRRSTLGFQDARRGGALRLDISDEGVPVLRNMVLALDGLVYGGTVLDTAVDTVGEEGTARQSITTPRLFKLGLVPRLFHTVASPPVAYLLFVIGAALLVFEFYTAGIGVAGVVGATSLVLGCYGFGVLPLRGWAVVLLCLSVLALAIDVQVGVPRFWTGVGLVTFTVASLWLYRDPVVRLPWLTLVAGVGGMALAFIVGMPSMVRTRFATPTVGREWMVGRTGEAVVAVDPDGVVMIDGAQWRARTNRATPIAQGATVRVVAIDGVTLEVEPPEGGAMDYRERARPSGVPTGDHTG